MPPKIVDLCLDIDVLTAESAANVVNKILEFLLFQRNQIPFVYNTYRYYVNKWPQDEEIDSVLGTKRNFQFERQRKEAKQTKESISKMRKVSINK